MKESRNIDEKSENRSHESRRAHKDQNQGKAAATGFHSETSEAEVQQLLKETRTEIGMSIENARIECFTKPIRAITRGNKYIRSANMLRRELRGRNLKIIRSMDAEERFHQKRMGMSNTALTRDNIPLNSISLNWTSKYVSVKGQIVVKTCQSGSLKYIKYQDIETEVEDQMEKWQSKNSSQRLWAVERWDKDAEMKERLRVVKCTQ